ncbi:hypothetical protein SAMN05216225_101047 [Ornithinibacillus halophilus]|uniref:Uncharacterized protein n=2 Tax=Ornithinibacillus halophilus TaxID=930117 RepID=A0A1M5FW56_9BACI|nr:hypothetical protein SAMN05216225_101047 [Ornithinibacillus halophilus]
MNKKILTIVLVLGIITPIFLFNIGEEDKLVISNDLLDTSKIDYIEVVGIGQAQTINISDPDSIEKIMNFLHQLNGLVIEQKTPADDSILGLHLVQKGHYPSSIIRINQDKIFFQGQGRDVSEEIVDNLIEIVKSTL